MEELSTNDSIALGEVLIGHCLLGEVFNITLENLGKVCVKMYVCI